MKTIKFLLAFLFIITLASCGKHSDGTSVWAGMLWILPFITTAATFYFGYKLLKSYQSGSFIITKTGERIDSDKKIIDKGWLFFTAFCLVLTIVIIILVNADK